MTTKKRGPARTGQLTWRATKGWCARIPLTIDGEHVRRTFELGTRDKGVARRKMARLISETASGDTTPDASAPLTVWDAVTMTVARWTGDGVRTVDTRIAQLRRHALGCPGDCPEHHEHIAREPHHIGHLSVTDVTREHIETILRTMQAAGLSKQSGVHQRRYLSAVFDDLWRSDLVAENPVAKVRPPKMRRDPRKRAVLTQDELVRYLAWVHPDDKHRGAVLERQTMSVVSWCFGGLRTGELHAMRWDDFSDDFASGFVRRGKTEELQALPVPEVMRPYLLRWWRHVGSPETGLVFPCRRGDDVGATRKQVSHAKALRRDLMRAFGVETRSRVSVHRGGGRGEIRPLAWVTKPFASWSRRERELFVDTETTRCVDFHSWRRAASGQLARAGVNEQTAMAFTHHTDAKTHRRYWAAAQMATLPAEALPNLPAPSEPGIPVSDCSTPSEKPESFRRAWQNSNLRPLASEASALSS